MTLITRPQVARRLRCNSARVAELLACGRLHVKRRGPNGRMYFDQAEVERLVTPRRQRPSTPVTGANTAQRAALAQHWENNPHQQPLPIAATQSRWPVRRTFSAEELAAILAKAKQLWFRHEPQEEATDQHA